MIALAAAFAAGVVVGFWLASVGAKRLIRDGRLVVPR
jgi:hypothetical protein